MTNGMISNREKMFKVADVVSHLLSLNGAKVIFGVSGGAALHILDSINKHPNLDLITTHHEQAAAMAAESTSRIGDTLGVAVATSGPGATNLITGVAGAFYDSVPSLFITGQVSTTRLSGNSGVRQLGFQETPIVEMVSKITKYAVQVTDPLDLIRELELCIQFAISGRQGPALLDIPDDIQRMYINLPNGLPTARVLALEDQTFDLPNPDDLVKLRYLVSQAIRPVIVLGWGVHLSGKERIIRDVLDQLKWPTLLTWGAVDFLDDKCEYRVGTFGTHGNRDANFVIQNSDLILSIGSRLDSKSTGTPVSSFSPNAKIIMIDVDCHETRKFSFMDKTIDIEINFNLKSHLLSDLMSFILDAATSTNSTWLSYVKNVKTKLARNIEKTSFKFVNPYWFISHLSSIAPQKTRIFVDTGCAIAWTCQSWIFKKGQRLYHDFNNTAMGWALPASLASLASFDDYTTIAIIGDGSFMMSSQELATVMNMKKPIKIFILNNSGYSMIKQTQDQWFESSYFASDAGSEMKFPDFAGIAQAYHYNYKLISADSNSEEVISNMLSDNLSYLCEVIISPDSRVSPQVKFGYSIEKMEPPIGQLLHESLMISSTTINSKRKSKDS